MAPSSRPPGTGIHNQPVYSQQAAQDGPCGHHLCCCRFSQPCVESCDTQMAMLSRGVWCRRLGWGVRKDKGTCQQVLHPSVLGAWWASQSFLAFGL